MCVMQHNHEAILLLMQLPLLLSDGLPRSVRSTCRLILGRSLGDLGQVMTDHNFGKFKCGIILTCL